MMLMRSATLSECGKYRYELQRRWSEDGLTVLWVMLNPSTADGIFDDPTIRRVIDFSQRLGFAALTVCNLFAYRSTDPDAMLALPADEARGPNNFVRLLTNAHAADKVICAWGNPGGPYIPQALESVPELWCMGRTLTGAPRHPLYLSKHTQPERFGSTW